MKKIFLILFLFCISLTEAQIQIYWDLDGDQLADETYTVSDGDTLTAYLYITNTDTADIVAGLPIYSFELPIIYGYYTRWNSSPDYTNILSFDSIVFDTTALMLDSSDVPQFNYTNNEALKRLLISFDDTNNVGIVADSCIAIASIIVDGTGTQILKFNYVSDENNNSVFLNTAVLNEKRVNYDLWIRHCRIISE